MVKVNKSDFWISVHAEKEKPEEEFNIKKIKMALVRAGVRSSSIIDEIAATVRPFEGMTTDEINKIVFLQLELKDPETAKYWKIKRDYNWRRFKK